MNKKQILTILFSMTLVGTSCQTYGMEPEQSVAEEKSNTSLTTLKIDIPNDFNTSQTEFSKSEKTTVRLSSATLVPSCIQTETEKNVLERLVEVVENQTNNLISRLQTIENKHAEFKKEMDEKLNGMKSKSILEALLNKEKTKISFWSRANNFSQGIGYTLITAFGVYTMIKERNILLESPKPWFALGAACIGFPNAYIKFRKSFFPSKKLYNKLKEAGI